MAFWLSSGVACHRSLLLTSLCMDYGRLPVFGLLGFLIASHLRCLV